MPMGFYIGVLHMCGFGSNGRVQTISKKRWTGTGKKYEGYNETYGWKIIMFAT